MKKIKKVLLINPAVTVSKGSIRRMPTPLGLLYIAGSLEKNSYTVSILDSACEGYENVTFRQSEEIYGLTDEVLRQRIAEEMPDFVGVTCGFSRQEEETFRTCRIVKSVFPNVFICVGGIHPYFFSKKILRECPEISFIIQKEGEYRLVSLIDAINEERNFGNIDGIAYRKYGEICINPAQSVIKDIDALPFPARHLVNMEKYIDIGLFGNPFPKAERVDQILTSRGCPYHCDFCATKPYWGNFRRRSAENVFTEILEVKQNYNIQEIQFRDDNLTVDKKNTFELFEKMKSLDLVWCSGVMIKGLDEEMIEAMANSGCYKLTISPESGSERVLRELINKPLRMESIKPVVDLAHKYNISIHSDFIVGYPGETKNEIFRTFEFAKEIETDSASFFLASAYPGSALFERCQRKGWVKEDSYKTDFKNAGIHISPSDPEYVMSAKALVELVDRKTREHNEWYKSRKPKRWNEKYKMFLKKHQNESDKILGRVV